MIWTSTLSAFLASLVEFVEALTIVLVVGVTINWKSAWAGTLAAILTLAGLVALFGTTLVQFIPIEVLRLIVGVILVLFGLKWLKKAILRYSGLKAKHDEEAIYEEELSAMKARGEALPNQFNGFGFVTAYKSVLLEGLEVAFIVITFGTSAAESNQDKGSALLAASLGALAAGVVVVLGGLVIHGPLTRIPENTLKFTVGVMLASFGTFWGGEGLGVVWPLEDAFLIVLVAAYLAVSGGLVLWLSQYRSSSAVAKPEDFWQQVERDQLDPLSPLKQEELQ
jgi:Ca2+/H+ antiporter, TMEM165/GDT1 family